MYFLFLLRKRKYPRPAYEHVAQPTSRRAARPTGTTGASTATNPRCQKKGGSLSDRRRSSRDQHTKPDAQPHGRKPEHVGRPARRWSKKRRPLWPTPLEQEPGTRTGCPAALARRLKTRTRGTSSQTMVKKKEAPVADAARAGTGNTNRLPSRTSQTIENQRTSHQPLAPARRLKNSPRTKGSRPPPGRTRKRDRTNTNAQPAAQRLIKSLSPQLNKQKARR